ncbi:MAG: phosphoribosyl-AMP cyclohydrolase [Spirochaetes bacterium]|nr:phosphoribosyl-AMP cyclohydrolase [Spirochaetota bacterium]
MDIKPDFEKGNGLIPAVVQDYSSGMVLMTAYMNEEAWLKTLETGYAHFFSRERKKLWKKGESSGNLQIVKSVFIDCDNDTVLLKVEQIGGAACHLGYDTCFFREIKNGTAVITGKKIFNPDDVYN